MWELILFNEIKFILFFLDDIKSLEEVLPLHQTQLSLSSIHNWCLGKCTLDLLKRRLPIISWLPKYNVEDLKGDLIAGMTVALTVIPQGLALATLAGLPPQVYSLAVIIYILMIVIKS